MNLELFLFNGYGQFVWPAFIFTFFSCFFLYAKTYKKFKRYEKLYLNEYVQNPDIKTEELDLRKPLSKSPIF